LDRSPCAALHFSSLSTGNFVQAIGAFLVHGVLSNVAGLPHAPPPVDAVDPETAAAQQVAEAYGAFLGIRGISDGDGDPLALPEIPYLQFCVFRQIAADKAPIVTEALLKHWPGA
jgi:predicted benzoate:H+ symporter BenE